MSKGKKTTSDDFLKILEDQEDDSSSMWSGGMKRPETRNEPVIKTEQIRNKPVSNTEQTRNEPVTVSASKFAPESVTRKKPVTKPLENPKQTRNEKSPVTGYFGCTRFQREILDFLFGEVRNSSDGITRPLSMAEFAEKLGRPDQKGRESLRIVVQRMAKEELLNRPKIRNGRGGHTQYSLPKGIFEEILLTQSRNKPVTDTYKEGNKPVIQPVTPAFSSSSNSLNSNNTTTTETSAHWASIKTPEILRQIGFGGRQVSMVMEAGKLSPIELQDSLENFAHDLESGALKIKTSPLNLLMGVLIKRGSPYMSEARMDAESEELNEHMRKQEQYLAAKEAQASRAFEEDFRSWVANLNEETRRQVVKDSKFAPEGSAAEAGLLREHFRSLPKGE